MGWELLWIIIVVFALGALTAYIFYLLTLQNTLKLIAPQNRKMRPGEVWLMLIPLFNYVWQFMMSDRIASSLEAELRSRGLPVTPRPTYNLGLTMSILLCCNFIPVVKSFAGIAYLVLLIIYWIKINEYRRLFLSTPTSTGDAESLIFGDMGHKP